MEEAAMRGFQKGRSSEDAKAITGCCTEQLAT